MLCTSNKGKELRDSASERFSNFITQSYSTHYSSIQMAGLTKSFIGAISVEIRLQHNINIVNFFSRKCCVATC